MNDLCLSKGIPERLHRLDKLPNTNFRSNESLYRRFNAQMPKETWLNNPSVSAAIFKLDYDSFNRELYCDDYSDVLFNINAANTEDHFFHHGVLSFTISSLTNVTFNTQVNGLDKSVNFEVIHIPEECMYPHTELHAYQDGVQVGQISPKSLRAIVRDIFVELSDVLKEPSSD